MTTQRIIKSAVIQPRSMMVINFFLAYGLSAEHRYIMNKINNMTSGNKHNM